MFIVDTTRINSIGNISGSRPLLPRSAPHKIYNIDRTIDILFQMNTHKNISELKTAGITSLRAHGGQANGREINLLSVSLMCSLDENSTFYFA